jgi:hypothetical protein
MKTSNKILIATLVFIMALIAISAIVIKSRFTGQGAKGDGNIVEISRSIDTFNKIRVSDRYTVNYTMNTEPFLVITADSNLIDHIRTRIVNNELIIDSEERLRSRNEIRLEVSSSDLIQVETSRAARFTANNLQANNMSLIGSAGSIMDITGVFENLNIIQNAGSRIDIKGESNSLRIEANAGADVNARQLEAQTASVRANAGANVVVNAQELDVSASTGSNVRYIGTPIISSLNISTGANVSKINQ